MTKKEKIVGYSSLIYLKRKFYKDDLDFTLLQDIELIYKFSDSKFFNYFKKESKLENGEIFQLDSDVDEEFNVEVKFSTSGRKCVSFYIQRELSNWRYFHYTKTIDKFIDEFSDKYNKVKKQK